MKKKYVFETKVGCLLLSIIIPLCVPRFSAGLKIKIGTRVAQIERRNIQYLMSIYILSYIWLNIYRFWMQKFKSYLLLCFYLPYKCKLPGNWDYFGNCLSSGYLSLKNGWTVWTFWNL